MWPPRIIANESMLEKQLVSTSSETVSLPALIAVADDAVERGLHTLVRLSHGVPLSGGRGQLAGLLQAVGRTGSMHPYLAHL